MYINELPIDPSRSSGYGIKGDLADFGQSLDTVRAVLGMDRKEDVTSGKVKKSLKRSKQFRNPVILRRIVTALNTFSLGRIV